MGILDVLNTDKYKKRILELEEINRSLKSEIDSLLSCEQKTVMELNDEIKVLKENKNTIENNVRKLNSDLTNLNTLLFKARNEYEGIVLSADFGLYAPKYAFSNSIDLKDKLKKVRDEQKRLIKEKRAINMEGNLTLDNDQKKGEKYISDSIKLSLICFNNECESIISKVKYNNIEAAKDKMRKVAEKIDKLNNLVRLNISREYINLKINELQLAYEYEVKKQEEKELLKEQREREKEEKAVLKEIEEKKKKIEKEVLHMDNIKNELTSQYEKADAIERIDIVKKMRELETKVKNYEDEKQELDYRIENIGAGYVYIISNIGAFGKDVLKIGVTRRIDPLDRISELSSASVPFKFDVHALIFSYNAYELETELHNLFKDYRINLVNNRKEFFKVSLDKVEDYLKSHKDITVDFTKDVDAKEYFETLKIRNISVES